MALGPGMGWAGNFISGSCALGALLLGLACGRFFSAWFPFRLSRRLFLPVKSPRLQKLLISTETHHWGRVPPRHLPEKYYRVSSGNRGKLCIWGALFYLDWFGLVALCALVWFGKLPARLEPLLAALPIGLPLLVILEYLDFMVGARRTIKAERLPYRRGR